MSVPSTQKYTIDEILDYLISLYYERVLILYYVELKLENLFHKVGLWNCSNSIHLFFGLPGFRFPCGLL